MPTEREDVVDGKSDASADVADDSWEHHDVDAVNLCRYLLEVQAKETFLLQKNIKYCLFTLGYF